MKDIELIDEINRIEDSLIGLSEIARALRCDGSSHDYALTVVEDVLDKLVLRCTMITNSIKSRS